MVAMRLDADQIELLKARTVHFTLNRWSVDDFDREHVIGYVLESLTGPPPDAPDTFAESIADAADAIAKRIVVSDPDWKTWARRDEDGRTVSDLIGKFLDDLRANRTPFETSPALAKIRPYLR